MKLRSISLLLSASCLLTVLPSPALESSETGLHVPAPAQKPKTTWLSHGANDVLKLARGKMPEEVILAFVNASKQAFNLAADEIVHLHDQGISDRIISAMIEKKAPAQPAPEVASIPKVYIPQEAPPQQPVQTVVTQPNVTYVQSPPVYAEAPASYGYSASYYPSYGYYPYYGAYWRSWYPYASFRYGYGHGHYAHHRAGYHHGGHYGGHHGGYSHRGHGGYSHGGGGYSHGGSHRGYSQAHWGGSHGGGVRGAVVGGAARGHRR